jgi:hypothetical protein
MMSDVETWAMLEAGDRIRESVVIDRGKFIDRTFLSNNPEIVRSRLG